MFTVETDHVALKWIMNDKEVQGRLARWALKLMCYNFIIVYKKGAHHKTADALSRLERHDASFYVTTADSSQPRRGTVARSSVENVV